MTQHMLHMCMCIYIISKGLMSDILYIGLDYLIKNSIAQKTV